MADGAADRNDESVREFFGVFSTGDVDGIIRHLHDDATWWVSGSVEGFSGERTKQEMRSNVASVTDIYTAGALRHAGQRRRRLPVRHGGDRGLRRLEEWSRLSAAIGVRLRVL